jgi:hypothetical protein
MRNAVIVAAAGCVMFLVALISGSVWAAVAVIVLALAGLALVGAELRAARRAQDDEQVAEVSAVLAPENFVPDITDSDSDDSDVDDVTEPSVGADEYGGDDFPFGEPFPMAEDVNPGSGHRPAPADDDTRIA